MVYVKPSRSSSLSTLVMVAFEKHPVSNTLNVSILHVGQPLVMMAKLNLYCYGIDITHSHCLGIASIEFSGTISESAVWKVRKDVKTVFFNKFVLFLFLIQFSQRPMYIIT